MELSFQLGALYKSATDSTLLRCRLTRSDLGAFTRDAETLFSRDLDIVWGDRHFIQIRNTTAKAVEMFQRQEELFRAHR